MSVSAEVFTVYPEGIVINENPDIPNEECYHSVPCDCWSNLKNISYDELLNLRVQFGKIVVDPRVSRFDKKINEKQAKKKIDRINVVLEKKFGMKIV